MRTLGVITARGGSKGIPRKNLYPLLGIPLLFYTARSAFESKLLSRVILSTEDQGIAEAGRTMGLDVPFMRPLRLAEDATPTVPVILHALEELERLGESFDAVFVLQPTNPLRTSHDIDGAINLLETTRADSVISFVDVGEKQPARMRYVDKSGKVLVPPFAELVEGTPRQKLPKLFLRDGSVYVTLVRSLKETGRLSGCDCRAWMIPSWRSCNIDTLFDLFLTEQILSHWDQLSSLSDA